MKAALIPSRGYEETALSSDIHLALPLAETMTNTAYRIYLSKARNRGDYIILDNGCAEGNLVHDNVLLSFAKEIGASEVVAPDVMSNASLTLTKTRIFLQNHGHALATAGIKVMGVLQAQNMQELLHLLEAYNSMPISTIGIPKVMIQKRGDDVRARIANMIHNTTPNRFEIHLLGLSARFPTEMYRVQFPPFIRSMDSAQPYKAAEEDVWLSSSVGHHKRRDDYFAEQKWTNETILGVNIQTFLAWAEKHHESRVTRG